MDPLSPKAKKVVDYVLNPYTVRYSIDYTRELKISCTIKGYAKILIWLYKHFYPGLWLLSKLRMEIFDNAVDAADAFFEIHPKDQNVLCLPRSVFVATTSKRFKKAGGMFIGVFLPSHHMHAWVIENGINAYRYDDKWTVYTPVSLMV